MESHLDLAYHQKNPRFIHDHGESSLALSQPLDTKSPGGQPPTDPVYAHGHGKSGRQTHAGSETGNQNRSRNNLLSNNFDLKQFITVNSHIRQERFDDLLQLINTDREKPKNMVDDSVLIIAICANKTQLAVKLIDKVGIDELKQVNLFNDTPLHIAAAEGDTTVVKALLKREAQLRREPEPWLIEALNNKGETALHKAAMYGHELTFRCLVDENEVPVINSRTYDGCTVLHSAIMANAPELALEIAIMAPSLQFSRNEAALTPLQLMATLPKLFRSQLVDGSFHSFLYKLIPVKEGFQRKHAIADEEVGGSIHTDRDEESYGWIWQSVRSKFPSECTTILDLIELIGSWSHRGVFNILKPFFPLLQGLEKKKRRYMAAMKLVEYLAAETGYDFYCKGLDDKPRPTAFDAIRGPETKKTTPEEMEWPDEVGNGNRAAADQDRNVVQVAVESGHREVVSVLTAYLCKFLADDIRKKIPGRWSEPPLITAAELGLHDLVRKILRLCPQSAIYLDSQGRNVVQVAVESGHRKVVRVLSEIFLRKEDRILHSFLCSVSDDKLRNTILHLAAEHGPAKEGDALQLHHDLKWFKMVEKIIPKELVYSRNKDEMTAHELFTKNHEATLKDCKNQLVELGKACAGLVAAAVFTSSFSIPIEKNNESGKLAYTIFSHAYVIGFGFATTALMLLLSLAITPYKERYFRRAIPRQFVLACLSFAVALAAFLVSFACNFVLEIYGEQKMQTMQLVKLLLELLLFPLLCIAVLVYSGAKLLPTLTHFWN